jgi:hypothetical protein
VAPIIGAFLIDLCNALVISAFAQAWRNRERHRCRNDNDIIIQAWNTVLFDKFLRFKHLLIDGSRRTAGKRSARAGTRRHARARRRMRIRRQHARHRARGRAAAAAPSASTARRVRRSGARGGRAEERAERRVLRRRRPVEDLRGPYDAVFARFGTMFFNLPGAAFRNIRKALVPGGELFMIVWRRREENPWLHDAELCVRGLVRS